MLLLSSFHSTCRLFGASAFRHFARAFTSAHAHSTAAVSEKQSPSPSPSAHQNVSVSASDLTPSSVSSTSTETETETEDAVEEARSLISASTIYANPICAQLDRQILRSQSIEDVLTLLVTHRGVFFVHNLVTALQTVALLSEQRSPAGGRASRPVDVLEALRDDRFEVLLQDLRTYADQLGIQSIARVVASLKKLKRRQYPLFQGLFRPLMKCELQTRDVKMLIACADAFLWAGYEQHPFYDRAASVFSDACVHWAGGERESEEEGGMTSELLVSACKLLARQKIHQRAFFRNAERALLRGREGSEAASALAERFSPTDVSVFAHAFASHLCPKYDGLFDAVASLIVSRPGAFTMRELTICANAFKRMALRYPEVLQVVCDRVLPHVETALRLRRPAALSPMEVSQCVEAVTFFGSPPETEWDRQRDPRGVRFPGARPQECPGHTAAPPSRGSWLEAEADDVDDGSSFSFTSRAPTGLSLREATRALTVAAARYLSEPYVLDDVEEGAAIKICFSVAMMGVAASVPYELGFLYRKIGTDTSWEREKRKVFGIFLSKRISWPWLDSCIHPRCVREGFRAWSLARGSPGGVRFPSEATEVSEELRSLAVPHRTQVLIDGPYVLDLALGQTTTLYRENKFENFKPVPAHRQRHQPQRRSDNGSPEPSPLPLGVTVPTPSGSVVWKGHKDSHEEWVEVDPPDRFCIMVVSEAARGGREGGTFLPVVCGETALEFAHIRSLGWRPLPVVRSQWRALDRQGRQALLRALVPPVFASKASLTAAATAGQLSENCPNLVPNREEQEP